MKENNNKKYVDEVQILGEEIGAYCYNKRNECAITPLDNMFVNDIDGRVMGFSKDGRHIECCPTRKRGI